jgi:hypothetical protein
MKKIYFNKDGNTIYENLRYDYDLSDIKRIFDKHLPEANAEVNRVSDGEFSDLRLYDHFVAIYDSKRQMVVPLDAPFVIK